MFQSRRRPQQSRRATSSGEPRGAPEQVLAASRRAPRVRRTLGSDPTQFSAAHVDAALLVLEVQGGADPVASTSELVAALARSAPEAAVDASGGEAGEGGGRVSDVAATVAAVAPIVS